MPEPQDKKTPPLPPRKPSHFGVLRKGVAAAVVAVGMSGPAVARPERAPSIDLTLGTMPVSVPAGWIEFCQRYKGECVDEGHNLPRALEGNAAQFKALTDVNSEVNALVQPISDHDHWGVVDRWDYPMDGKGDCEDYALLKRKLLIDKHHFPKESLRMAVVNNKEKGEYHAILLAKFGKDSYLALDNLSEKPLTVAELHDKYDVVKMQSDHNQWVKLDYTSKDPARNGALAAEKEKDLFFLQQANGPIDSPPHQQKPAPAKPPKHSAGLSGLTPH